MPLSTHRRRFRKAPRKRSTRPTTSMAVSIAKKALRKVNQAEKKFKDSQLSDTGMPLNGSIFNLANIPRGQSANQRDGRETFIQSIQIRGFLRIASAVITATQVRVLLCGNVVANATLPIPADVLKSGVSVISHRNLDNTRQIRVYSDRVYRLNQDDNQLIQFKINKTWKNGYKQKYVIGATGGAFTDQEQGSLYLMFLSDELINVPQISMEARVRFTDS